MKSKATASATSSATTPNEISVGVISTGRSRILEDDALDQIGDVLAAIGDRLEQLESVSDRCEDVANLIEGVVLENS